jgi:hypothetical protein
MSHGMAPTSLNGQIAPSLRASPQLDIDIFESILSSPSVPLSTDKADVGSGIPFGLIRRNGPSDVTLDAGGHFGIQIGRKLAEAIGDDDAVALLEFDGLFEDLVDEFGWDGGDVHLLD